MDNSAAAKGAGAGIRRPRLLPAIVSLAWLAIGCADISMAPLRTVTVTGSVTRPDAVPLAQATLLWSRDGAPGLDGTTLATTDHQGRYTTSLAEGSYRVTLYVAEDSGVPGRVETTAVARGSEVRFDYVYGGSRVTGTVTGPLGAPVPNARVWFFGRSGKTQTITTRFLGGAFVAYVPPGEYEISAEPPSSVDGTPTRRIGRFWIQQDTSLALALTGHRVTGRVYAPDGSPLAGATIWYDDVSGASGSACNSGADGAYELYVPDGAFGITVYPGLADRYLMGRSFGVLPVTGAVDYDLRFQGIRWNGVVRNAGTTEPVAGAMVSVYQDDSDINPAWARAQVTTDASGSFSLSLLPGRVHSLQVSAPFYRYRYVYPLVSGADSTFDLLLEPADASAP